MQEKLKAEIKEMAKNKQWKEEEKGGGVNWEVGTRESEVHGVKENHEEQENMETEYHKFSIMTI